MTLKSIIERVARDQQGLHFAYVFGIVCSNDLFLYDIISVGHSPTPHASQVSRCREADTLLQRYRTLQAAAKQPLKVEQTKCRLVCTSL